MPRTAKTSAPASTIPMELGVFPRDTWGDGPIPAYATLDDTDRCSRVAGRAASQQWATAAAESVSNPPSEAVFGFAVIDKALELNHIRGRQRLAQLQLFSSAEEWVEDTRILVDKVYDQACRALQNRWPGTTPPAHRKVVAAMSRFALDYCWTGHRDSVGRLDRSHFHATPATFAKWVHVVVPLAPLPITTAHVCAVDWTVNYDEGDLEDDDVDEYFSDDDGPTEYRIYINGMPVNDEAPPRAHLWQPLSTSGPAPVTTTSRSTSRKNNEKHHSTPPPCADTLLPAETQGSSNVQEAARPTKKRKTAAPAGASSANMRTTRSQSRVQRTA